MLLRQFRSPSRLSEYIDSILLQEDFNPVNYANRNPVKVLPSALTVIGIHYGNRMRLIGGSKEHLLSTSGITGLQTTFKEYVSTGAIGTIIVRFRPGGLTAFTARFIGDESSRDSTEIELIHFIGDETRRESRVRLEALGEMLTPRILQLNPSRLNPLSTLEIPSPYDYPIGVNLDVITLAAFLAFVFVRP